MSLRRRIILLYLAVLVPAAAASILAVRHIYGKETQSFRASLQETARALALVVDREMVAHEAVLTTLATSPSLAGNDLPAFRKQLQDLAKSRGVMFTVTSADGQTLLSEPPNVHQVLTPPAAKLPELMKTATPEHSIVVSSLQGLPKKHAFWFSVHRPVWIDAKPRYYLTLVLPVLNLEKVLGAHRLPDKWLGLVLDGSGAIAANSLLPKAGVGMPIPAAALKQVTGGQTEGVFDYVDEHLSAVAAFSRAPVSGWTFLIGVPFSEAGRGAWNAVTMIVAIHVLLLGAATVVAIRLGRSIQRPILRLAEAATALGKGEAHPETRTSLREVEVVSFALSAAGTRIREASAVMEKRVAEAVTASEQSQRALLQAQKLEALGRLTGGIAHDFNNLLQTMATGLELARECPDDPLAKEALDACDGAVGRAAKLTRQLAAFGRNQVSEARPLDLRSQILAFQDLCKSALRRQISFTLDLPPDLWRVCVDPVQFEMAVLNLVFNARDAIPGNGEVLIWAGNKTIAADATTEVAPGDYVCVGVRDSGTGMSEETLSKALEPFFTTKPVGEGSGLGLPQIYGFAKQSGGQLVLMSQPGRGTEAMLYLPRCHEALSIPDRSAPKKHEPTTGGAAVTVLVVEDDILVRDVVGPALISYGFVVITAATGEEALTLFEAHPQIEVVFSDIVMPGRLNGIELAAVIRDRRPNMPIVLATGYSEHAVNVSAGLRVMTKPYDIAMLAALLRETLREHRR